MMPEQDKPIVTVVHRLAGRLRLRLSRAPRQVDKMMETIREHPGLYTVVYTDVTRSVLVRFDPAEMPEEEILLRVALSLSLDYGAVPVRVCVDSRPEPMSDLALLAALVLGVTFGTRTLLRDPARVARWEWLSGLSVAAAVVHHGWQEVRERGYCDPEVLSLGYLLMALRRGNALRASLVTWLLTFGRHLFTAPRGGIEVRPLATGLDAGGLPRYEVVVGRDTEGADTNRLRQVLQGVLKFGASGMAGGPGLMEELQRVSSVHGEVLEGMGWMPHGIPVRFR